VRFLRGSLFVRIYLTFLAGLVGIVLAGGLIFMASQHGEGLRWGERRDRFLAEMLPAEPDAASQERIYRLSRAFDADLTLYTGRGRLIAVAGAPLPFESGRGGRWTDDRQGKAFAVDLPGDRVIVARLRGGFPGEGQQPLLYLAMVALVTAAAAYPVVRHLTRRLESLRAGAQAWGAGDLSVRVPEKGSDEVSAVARSFNAAAERIEDLLRAHRDLLAHASHELRSPLARLRMAIDLFEENRNEAARAEIVRNLAELDSLVEEILLGSRLDHQSTAPVREEVDLLALAAEEAARHGVEADGEPVLVNADPRLIHRLVSNLIQNALRHGAPPVSVHVGRSGPLARIEVCDAGAGLPPGEADNVFKPFYRPPGRSESAGGWGLGLSLVRRIAELHGGTATYLTGPDGRPRFRVDLPI
jgi:two-component system OmpR family sensor kinase